MLTAMLDFVLVLTSIALTKALILVSAGPTHLLAGGGQGRAYLAIASEIAISRQAVAYFAIFAMKLLIGTRASSHKCHKACSRHEFEGVIPPDVHLFA